VFAIPVAPLDDTLLMDHVEWLAGAADEVSPVSATLQYYAVETIEGPGVTSESPWGGLAILNSDTTLVYVPQPVNAAPPPLPQLFAAPNPKPSALAAATLLPALPAGGQVYQAIADAVAVAVGQGGSCRSILVRGREADLTLQYVEHAAEACGLHLLALNCSTLSLGELPALLTMAMQHGPALVFPAPLRVRTTLRT
jgi:hypothetical protein